MYKVKGQRGTGKTTKLLEYAKEHGCTLVEPTAMAAICVTNITKINDTFAGVPVVSADDFANLIWQGTCDLLNNAIRFIRNGQTEAACEAIIQAIDEANGYFHQDNALFIDEVRLRRSAKRNFIVKRIYAQEQERPVE